jgi:hypothetical protein
VPVALAGPTGVDVAHRPFHIGPVRSGDHDLVRIRLPLWRDLCAKPGNIRVSACTRLRLRQERARARSIGATHSVFALAESGTCNSKHTHYSD